MAKRSKSKFSYIFITLVLGGAVALIGYSELIQKDDFSFLNKKSRTLSSVNSRDLMEVLHGETNIERASISPESIKRMRKDRDKLNSRDKSAMKKLIEKIVD